MSESLCMNNFSTIHHVNLDLVYTFSNTSCNRKLLKLIHMCSVDLFLNITHYIFLNFLQMFSKQITLTITISFNMLYITHIYIKHNNKCVSSYLFLFVCIYFRLTMWCALLDSMNRTVTRYPALLVDNYESLILLQVTDS